MHYSEVIDILNETRLSPEDLAQWIHVSNSTYRRWQKAPGNDDLPEEYRHNVAAGIYSLLGNGKLSYESAPVARFIEHNIPDFFHAAAGQFSSAELLTGDSTHQDKITAILSHLGGNSHSRQRVDRAKKEISKFAGWGSEWKHRIRTLSQVLVDKQLTLFDRLVAYGALFYLILPFDLVPDSIPVFGYVDDFGILGFATAYYVRRFPHIKKMH